LREAADREENPTSETGADVEGAAKTLVNTEPAAPPAPAALSSDGSMDYSVTAADDQAGVGMQNTSDVEAPSRVALMKRVLPFLTP
jgi:hypothetical protein